LHGSWVNAADSLVLGTRVELATGEAHGGNETSLLVSLNKLHALCVASVVCPLVDTSVGTSSVAALIRVPDDAGEGGLWVSVEETLFLLSVNLPEVDMLGSSSGESFRSTFHAPGDILDAVGVSIGLHDLLATLCLVHIDVMFVVKIDAGNMGVVLAEGNSGDTS